MTQMLTPVVALEPGDVIRARKFDWIVASVKDHGAFIEVELVEPDGYVLTYPRTAKVWLRADGAIRK